jgi:DNA-binding NtrC family response regulator
MNSARFGTRIFIVGRDRALRARLMRVAARTAHADGCGSFKSARARLTASRYDLLVTDARLGAYSGIHLVYLAKLAHPSIRAVVYDKDGDLEIGASVHRSGAFFEVAPRLLLTLRSYIVAPLPATDRRMLTISDRRLLRRGGRRLGDRQVVRSATASAPLAHY